MATIKESLRKYLNSIPEDLRKKASLYIDDGDYEGLDYIILTAMNDSRREKNYYRYNELCVMKSIVDAALLNEELNIEDTDGTE